MNIETNGVSWLEQKIAACKENKKALCADERADEATFEQIRVNVYDIFKTVLTVGAKNSDPEKNMAFFRQRLETIPRAWREALANAEAHDDGEKAQIERVKLEALEEIRTHFETVWGEEA